MMDFSKCFKQRRKCVNANSDQSIIMIMRSSSAENAPYPLKDRHDSVLNALY